MGSREIKKEELIREGSDGVVETGEVAALRGREQDTVKQPTDHSWIINQQWNLHCSLVFRFRPDLGLIIIHHTESVHSGSHRQ